MISPRHNWTKEEVLAIYNKPLMDLLYEAASIHREHHDPMWFKYLLYYQLKQVHAQKTVNIALRAIATILASSRKN